MLTVGYIGPGIMVLKAGFPVVVHNRSRAAVMELVGEGARQAFSPSEVAAQTDIVFTNLPDSPDAKRLAKDSCSSTTQPFPRQPHAMPP